MKERVKWRINKATGRQRIPSLAVSGHHLIMVYMTFRVSVN